MEQPDGNSQSPIDSSAHEFARTHENIPTHEYEAAVKRIKEFHEQDRDSISSLDELAEVTAGLGDAWMKVAHVKGEKDEKTKCYIYPKSVLAFKRKLEEEMEDYWR